MYKYLNDGRKVAVVGQLNSKETIVQEIFVSKNGEEIPSGENFVVKSLHDEPVESWKSKKEKDLEKSIKGFENEVENKNRELKKINEKLRGFRDILRSTERFVETFEGHDLDLISSFMTGSINFIVVENYSNTYEIKRFEDFILNYEKEYYGNLRYDGIKLCSILGDSDGNLSYHVNQYRDGSGSWAKIHPFEKYEDAVELIKNKATEAILKNRFTKEDFFKCQEIGIVFANEVLEVYIKSKKAKDLNSIQRHLDQIEKLKIEIEKIKSDEDENDRNAIPYMF